MELSLDLFDTPAHDLTYADLADLTDQKLDTEALRKIHDADFIPLEEREW